MRIILQKVQRAFVEVEGKIVGQIGDGFVLLIGIKKGDTEQEADYLVEKILKLRLFSEPGSDTFMEKNIVEHEGGILAISQFTLYGDCKKGTRPSFTDVASPDDARELYEYIVYKLRDSELLVETGEFGEHMEVLLVNDGPITLVLER